MNRGTVRSAIVFGVFVLMFVGCKHDADAATVTRTYREGNMFFVVLETKTSRLTLSCEESTSAPTCFYVQAGDKLHLYPNPPSEQASWVTIREQSEKSQAFKLEHSEAK